MSVRHAQAAHPIRNRSSPQAHAAGRSSAHPSGVRYNGGITCSPSNFVMRSAMKRSLGRQCDICFETARLEGLRDRVDVARRAL